MYTYHIKPLVWLRFIDDIFSIFVCSRAEIETFVEYLCSRKLPSSGQSLKFTATISDVQVDFLDTTVKIDPDTRKVYTTLYTKPTDTHDYLLYTSAHPKHCKNNTPYSQLMRIRKICTLDADFTENSQMILAHFHRRGYPLPLLESAWAQAKTLNRETLIKPKTTALTQPANNNYFLTTTYNPGSPDLKGILTKNWDLISIPPYDLNIDQSRVKTGYRRCPNLKEKLCSSTIDYPPSQIQTRRQVTWDPSMVPNVCNTPNCKYCALLEHHGRVICHKTTRTYHAPMGVTCKSNNLIYLITCKKCLAQYVGETYRPLHKRMYEHTYAIRKNKKDSPVGVHFNLPGHSIENVKFEVASFVYLHVPPESDDGCKIRKAVEKKWIHRMKTDKAPGLNIQG